MTKGKRGGGSKHQLLWEEVPFLKVEKTGKPVAIYKREDVQKDLPLEQRNYYAHFPIRGTRGKRMSLLVAERLPSHESCRRSASLPQIHTAGSEVTG